MEEMGTTMNNSNAHRPARVRRWAAVAGSAVLAVTMADVAVTSAAPNRAAFAPVSIDLCATTGTATLPLAGGGTTGVAVWGYVLGDCTSGAGTAAVGQAPVIQANAGDTVTINLHNGLTEATSLAFQGQPLPSDMAGVAPSASKPYTFTATAGTFLYEAGPTKNMAHQIAMGMHGVLKVLPATAGQAYAPAATAFDVETTVLISEIDPALALNPTTFDMRTFAAKWTLLNGKASPNVPVLASAAAGQKVLIRYVNAGSTYHSMSLLGAEQTVIAEDGNVRTFPYKVVAQTVGPGVTTDMIVQVPATAKIGSRYTVFDGNLQTRNMGRKPAKAGNATYGGAVGFIEVSGTAGPDVAGPLTSAVAMGANLTATVSDVTTGGSNVAAAEYFVDSLGLPGTGTAMTGTFGSPTVNVTTVAPVVGVGFHTIYVRGLDAAGNWGAVTAFVPPYNTADTVGPISSAFSITPAIANGVSDITLHGTISDATTGGSAILGAEVSINGGGWIAVGDIIKPNGVDATTVSFEQVIPASALGALADGTYTIDVRGYDVNAAAPGAVSSFQFVLDRQGPAVVGFSYLPYGWINGQVGVQTSIPAVRVKANIYDERSGVRNAEIFLDNQGVTGNGAVMVQDDGIWNIITATKGFSLDVPLSTFRLHADGDIQVWVHARDFAGNWGGFYDAASSRIKLDKVAPTQSSVAVDSSNFLDSVLTGTAADALSGVMVTNYSLDGGTATAASGTTSFTAHFGPLSNGPHSVLVTTYDLAGNSVSTTVNFTVQAPVWFSTAGNSNPPGVGGTADDADIYKLTGSAFSRNWDATTHGVPSGSNVDGYSRVNDTQFYVSFSGSQTLPGISGTVQDEDIVYYNNGLWSLWFDGSANGFTGDIDGFDIVGGTLFFSTDANFSGGDNGDIFQWNGGSSYTRVVNLSSGNIDGLSYIDSTHFFVSFSSTTTNLPGGLSVQDEDIVYYNGSTWSVWFDGTAAGLTSNNLDIDAFDVG